MNVGVRRVGIKTIDSLCRCDNCKKSGEIKIQSQCEYFHLMYLIPLFSLGKSSKSKCINCGEVLNYIQMPYNLKCEAKALEERSKVPIWHHSGVFILITFILYLVFILPVSIKQDKENDKIFIEQPILNDIYIYYTDDKKYTLLKVDSISDDTIYILENLFSTKMMSDIETLDKLENYQEWRYEISKNDLKKLHSENHIIKVIRK